jgi:hypothetical protein
LVGKTSTSQDIEKEELVNTVPGLVPENETSVASGTMTSLWTRVRSPNVGVFGSSLRAVAALGPDLAWAVGSWTPSPESERTLTQRWDSSAWQNVDSPNANARVNVLLGVAAATPTRLWAVGYSAADADTDQTTLLLLAGDGSSWTAEPVEAPGRSSDLAAVTMIDDNEGWAVGSFTDGDSGLRRALVLHLSGGVWEKVTVPDAGLRAVRLTGVSGRAADDVWAVGFSDTGAGDEVATILHWDGKAWLELSGPKPVEGTQTVLWGVTAHASDEAWAVGYTYPTRTEAEKTMCTFAMRWSGRVWTVVPSPTDRGTQLRSVTAAGPGVWSVGYQQTSLGEIEMVLTFDGLRLSRELLPPPDLPGGPRPNPSNVTGTALSSVAADAGQLWTVGWKGVTSPPPQEFGGLTPPPSDPPPVAAELTQTNVLTRKV